jgi:DNA-binding MurR/RpiR family transcriptional regulator
MTGMERLLAYYNSSPPDSMQSAIVRNILAHVRKIGDLTIFDLADLCFTSAPSISRLVRKLGYKNYAYFQKDLLDSVRKYDIHNRLVSPENRPEEQEMAGFFFDTLDDLYRKFREQLDYDKVHELNRIMHEAEKVAIYSYSIYFTEVFIQSDVFMSGKICDIHHQEKDILEHVKVLSPNDLVILMAPAGVEGLNIEVIIREIRNAGAKFCVITDSRRLAKNSQADISFPLPGVKQAVDMFIMQLFLCVVEIEYRKLYLDE